MSFLRLIPKAGKDLKKLTNWRPITLSNCDHKLITKTYAIRMSEKVSSVIAARQTAYLKGRQINDNIRGLLMSIHLSNVEGENLDGLIVSLDAKKAFDSVEHSYIEKCLEKFGLGVFIPIFKILYSGLKSDILVNGKVVPGYRILRGVKQGDALSCILFIMCMEPLILNIEVNPSIEALSSVNLGASLPKAYTYADDLNCAIRRTNQGLQAIFDEYSRLTKHAGLELNADKTEIMRFASELRGTNFVEQRFNVNYLGKNYGVETVKETKINGILFQQDETAMRTRNVEQVRKKIESQLSKWSKRGLTTLGKILIVKTFGISQIIYLLQSMTLEKSDFKLLNEILYKFIWNKHFRAAKAPERVKREIINLKLSLGGYGMLDVEALDKGLKLRALGRLFVTEHPALKLVKNKIDFGDFFFPKLNKKIDKFVSAGLGLLSEDRQSQWDNVRLTSDLKLLSALRECKTANLVRPEYVNNLAIYMMNRAGRAKVGDLNQGDLAHIGPLLTKRDLGPLIERARALRLPAPPDENKYLYYYRDKWVQLSKLTSKEIRENRNKDCPLDIYKCGLILGPNEVGMWLSNLKGLESTGHKNAVLRLAHGDIYSKSRLFRFGMVDSPMCEQCNELETINHKIFECRFAKALWTELDHVTGHRPREIDINYVMGAFEGCTKAEMVVHAELITRLTRNLDTGQLNRNAFIRTMIKSLVKKVKGALKQELENLLRP